MKKVLLTAIVLMFLMFFCSVISRAEIYVPGSNLQNSELTAAAQETLSNFTVQVDISHFPYDWNEIVEVYCTKDGVFYGDYDLSQVNDYKYNLFLMPGNYKFISRVRYDRLGLYYLDNAACEFVFGDTNLQIPQQYIITAYENKQAAATGDGMGLSDAAEIESAYSEIERWELTQNLPVKENTEDELIENQIESRSRPFLMGYSIIIVVLVIFILYMIYLKRAYEGSKDE
ncbi:MAG: hypothetical protein LIP16_20560 [Clostridium sp.]|nr:hypothetical protein [Clostridium sp.]